MSGGGSKQPANTTQTVSTIPKWAEPYAMDMLGRGQWLTNQPYTSYLNPESGRNINDVVAPASPLQNQSFYGMGQMRTAPQVGAATGLAALAGRNATQAGGYDPLQVGTLYNSPGFTGMGLGYNNVASGNFTDPGAASSYMSPYMQNVTDILKRQALRDADIAGTKRGFTAATTSGTYGGGSRQAIENAEANRNLALQLGDIEAKGLQDSYAAAMAQFNADQGRGLQAGMANQQAGLTTNEQMLNQLANLNQFGLSNAQNAAQYGLAGLQLGEESRQFGAGLGMDAIQQQLAAAGLLGELGQTQFGQQMDTLRGQQEFGGVQRDIGQQQRDWTYQDWSNALNFPYQQMGWYSNILHGLPTDQSSRIYGYPNTAAQTVGNLGGLASLYMANQKS